jgi:hypothetical protein
MDTSHKELLDAIAAEAGAEHSDFLAQASAQLRRFLEANAGRISALGGLVLIDDDADYLAVAADLTFRSRSHYQDETTGKWITETEIIENPSELIEVYNPADIYAAFADAAKTAPGAGGEEADDDGSGAAPDTVGSQNPYAGAADEWAAARDDEPSAETPEEAAERLYDLALVFQERSQQTEAHLLEQFESAACRLTSMLGDLVIVSDDDERLMLTAQGSFVAEVVPEDQSGSGRWRKLSGPEDVVEFYDPTDIFGDLADTLAEAYALDEESADEDSAEEDSADEESADEDSAEEDSAEEGEVAAEDSAEDKDRSSEGGN